jgi:hypothetical protein
VPAKKDYGDGNLRWTSGPGRGGRFAPKGGKAAAAAGSGPVRAPKPAALKRASDDDVLEWFHRVSQRPAGTPGVNEALAALDAELTRREGAVNLQRAKSARVHELVDGGASYLDAWAEVHGVAPADLEREQRQALVDAQRRPGESRTKTLRRMFDERVHIEMLQAEDDTAGNLLSPAGRAYDQRLRRKGGFGLDPASLWEGSTDRARRYASEELKRWWEQHGGRTTPQLFRSHYTGDRKAAERARAAGQGKDFGV